MEESTANLTLTSLSLVHEGNYSCAGVNLLGTGEEDSFQLEVTGESRHLLSKFRATVLVFSPAKVLGRTA